MQNWSCDSLPEDPAAARVMARRFAEGCRAGIGIPVRGPAGQFSVTTFWSHDAGRLSQSVRQHCGDLHALAVYLHAGGFAGRAQGHVLSPVEVECLRWTAQGKTAWEISVLMSMPERTVHYHVGEASRKLGAPNKTAAACIALKAGILDP